MIAEYAGLFIATSLWNFKESRKWNKHAKSGLEHEIVRQHSENGINKEEAAEYIQFITDFFLLSYIVGENSENPFSEKYKIQLKAIFSYINNFLDRLSLIDQRQSPLPDAPRRYREGQRIYLYANQPFD